MKSFCMSSMVMVPNTDTKSLVYFYLLRGKERLLPAGLGHGFVD